MHRIKINVSVHISYLFCKFNRKIRSQNQVNTANLVYFINFKGSDSYFYKIGFPCWYFTTGTLFSRFCGSSFGNVQQLTSDTNVMLDAMFRSDFTVKIYVLATSTPDRPTSTTSSSASRRNKISAGTSGNSKLVLFHGA